MDCLKEGALGGLVSKGTVLMSCAFLSSGKVARQTLSAAFEPQEALESPRMRVLEELVDRAIKCIAFRKLDVKAEGKYSKCEQQQKKEANGGKRAPFITLLERCAE